MRAAAQTLGLELSAFSAKPPDIEASFAAISSGGYEGLVLTTDPFMEQYTARIIQLAAERRLPAIYPFSTAVAQGGLMSYSADLFAMWRRAGSDVDRILKGEQSMGGRSRAAADHDRDSLDLRKHRAAVDNDLDHDVVLAGRQLAVKLNLERQVLP